VAEIVSHSLKSRWETIVRVVDPVMMLDIVLVTSCDVPSINQSLWDPKKMISNRALLVAEIVSHSLKSLWETIVRVVDPVMMLDIVLVTSCDVPPINQSVWDPKKMKSNRALLVAKRVSHFNKTDLDFELS
jgi:molybdopterin-guanine dinucleotide biosynthesis protein A